MQNDETGESYSPFRPRRKYFKSLSADPVEVCSLLNDGSEWELHSDARFAFQCEYEVHGEKEVVLPNGAYYYDSGDGNESFRPLELRNDKFISIPDQYGPVIQDVESFLLGEQRYADLGIPYRRGILLYGPPGNGKSHLIRNLITKLIPSESILLFWDDLPRTRFLEKLKLTLKNRLKVIIFEELIAVVNRNRIDRILSFLDGETSSDKTLVFATTNYPEQLPGNLIDRPSRFDCVYEVKNPIATSREIILGVLLRRPASEEDVKCTHGFSIADLKELTLLHRIQGIDFQLAVRQMAAHRKKVKKHFAKAQPIGINGRSTRFIGVDID